MRFFSELWSRLRRRPKVALMVMNAEDMLVAHPDTDWTHVCSICGQKVGLYPSSLELLRTHENVTIVCNRCTTTSEPMTLVPGAEHDVRR